VTQAKRMGKARSGLLCFSDATTSTAWRCCCCSPSLLENSISQYEKALVSTPVPSINSSGSDHSSAENGVVDRYVGFLVHVFRFL
jgi:hypothetical protein